MAQAGRHIDLTFERFFGIGDRGGTKRGVHQTFHRNDPNGDFLLGREVCCIEQHGARHRRGGLEPQLVELVSAPKDRAGHVLWVSHDP